VVNGTDGYAQGSDPYRPTGEHVCVIAANCWRFYVASFHQWQRKQGPLSVRTLARCPTEQWAGRATERVATARDVPLSFGCGFDDANNSTLI